MDKNNDLNNMLCRAEFDHIKEMLFCMDRFSCNDKELMEIINSNGGLDKYFEQVTARYIMFLQNNKNKK